MTAQPPSRARPGGGMPEAILAMAETIPIPTPAPAWVTAAASRTLARHAADKDDLAGLLAALALPAGEDDLAALLPLLTSEPDHTNGETVEPTTDTTQPAAPAADLDALLAWADQHPTAGIRNRAARVRDGLDRLATEHAKEQAVAEAEAEIARLKQQLAAAEASLREAKTSGQTTPTASSPARPTDREELRRIRAWAKDNGYEVADRGAIPNKIREAYAAAHTGEHALAS